MVGPPLRVLVDAALDGATNMARDRALWREREDGGEPSPLLRIYRWSPPALSLGYHQTLDDTEREAFRRRGIDVVRRPTGGSAVLHHQEITYALTAPRGTRGLGDGVAEIYSAVADALVEALGRLGIEATRGGGGRPEGFACFGAAGGHEITVGGRKLVGSAQRRGRVAFLQHGSILTGPGHLEIFPDDGPQRRRRRWLAERTTDLADLGFADVGPKEMAEALAGALARRLDRGVQWVEAVDEAVLRHERELLAGAAAPPIRS